MARTRTSKCGTAKATRIKTKSSPDCKNKASTANVIVQPKHTSRNAARERSRVRSLRHAFQALQDSLPAVPRHTKLSKLDVLVLAASYIAHLSQALDPNPESAQNHLPAYLHPVRKWPMRSRLYAGLDAPLSLPTSHFADDIVTTPTPWDLEDLVAYDAAAFESCF